MSQSLTLIQLISEQTMQNVLPILALQPTTVVSVVSQEIPRFVQATDHIKAAVTLAAKQRLITTVPHFTPLNVINSDSPRIEEARQVVAAIYQKYPEAILNYTGGTKNMSIGAWLAASATKSAGAIYCDTPRAFRSELPREVRFSSSLSELAKKLTVEIILAAQGFRRGQEWTAPSEGKAEERFGEVAFQLELEKPQAMKQLRAVIQQHGLDGRARKPSRADLDRATQQPLPLGDLEPQVTPFLKAAVQCGLLRRSGSEWFLCVAREGSLKKRARRLEAVLMRLDGGAFEGYVQACLKKSCRFTQFIHGIRPREATETADFGETDFLAFDPEELSLTLITCKSSPPPLEHLESVLARKEKLGGRFARGILCVRSMADRQEASLRTQLRRLGLELAVGAEVAEVFQCPTTDTEAPTSHVALTHTNPGTNAPQKNFQQDGASASAVEALFRISRF